MKEKQLRELLQNQVSIFINNIAFELEQPHDQLFEGFGFPVFRDTSKEYHEQVYFQSYLESYTRKMINAILKEICYEDVGDEIIWPEFEFLGIYNGYTNTECERKFKFEFYNKDTKTGYRYTCIRDDTIEQLLNKDIQTIKIVDWQNDGGIVYADKRVEVILIWDLFQELFDDLEDTEIRLMYDLFMEYVSKAIAQAGAMISLTTIPGFTSLYLYKTRVETVTSLRKEVRSLTSFTVNTSEKKYVEDNSKELIDTDHLQLYFLDRRFEFAFVGSSDFAKSYQTSEYLYRHFKENTMFDLTPVVSGYLKSIEQLLHLIYENYLSVKQIERDLSNYTLGDYTAAFFKEKMVRWELVKSKGKIVDCLNSYRDECRNHLFHKDYLNSWVQVEQIRRNTIFLYVILLGSVDIAYIKSKNNSFGFINLEYDELFSILDKRKAQNYSFILGGMEYIDWQKDERREGLMFDENGCITNTISFRKLQYDEYEVMEISRTNMPSELWATDYHGEKKKKLWPYNADS